MWKKKMTGCRIRRVGFFIAYKVVGLSLNIWPSRKALKCLLQNIYLMLDLLYCKCNPFIVTVVDGSIFFKSLTWEKNRRYFYPGITMMKLWLILKHICIGMKSFLNYFALKIIFLNILQNVSVYLFKYCGSHITIISRNDTFLYYRINQISMCCTILWNAFLAPE